MELTVNLHEQKAETLAAGHFENLERTKATLHVALGPSSTKYGFVFVETYWTPPKHHTQTHGTIANPQRTPKVKHFFYSL